MKTVQTMYNINIINEQSMENYKMEEIDLIKKRERRTKLRFQLMIIFSYILVNITLPTFLFIYIRNRRRDVLLRKKEGGCEKNKNFFKKNCSTTSELRK